MVKMFFLIIAGLTLVFLQIICNPSGYNYLSCVLLVLAVAYFDQIKTIHAGIFKLEKYEKIANHIDETIICYYNFSLKLTLNQKNFSFCPECALFINYNDIKLIFEDIRKLPNSLRQRLNDSVKNYALKTLHLQKSFLYGSPYRLEETPSLDYDKIPERIKEKPDYHEACEAYNFMLNIVEHGVL